jgi:putative transposase
MPRNVYSEINLLITWHTRDNLAIVTDRIEERLHHLRDRAIQTPGVYVHAVNGMPDHSHMAVSIPPTPLISDWIGELSVHQRGAVHQSVSA